MNTNPFQNYTANDYIDALKGGNISALSRAISLIESSAKKHQQIAQELLEGCLPLSGNSIRIGITGVPGVGKSTFIETFGMLLIEEQHKVAVLSIDPSSTLGKGSILGDKTRMVELSRNANAYIRPTASGTALGGVAHKTREAILLCEAAGFDIIIIETVGVGQNEIRVHDMVDIFLLLSLAGAGDELQGIKRGIIEMADLIVFNKCDGANLQKVNLSKTELENALHYFPTKKTVQHTQVLTCSALEKTGIDTVWNTIQQFIKTTKENAYFDQNRQAQLEVWFEENLHQQLSTLFLDNNSFKESFMHYQNLIRQHKITPIKAANELIKLIKKY